MAYRSQRFPAGEMNGLAQAWAAIDHLERINVPIVSEVMAGRSYRRQLHPEAIEEHGDSNYVLQAVFQPGRRKNRGAIRLSVFFSIANGLLEEMELPGEASHDLGGLKGQTAEHQLPFGSADPARNSTELYAPWIKSVWEENGKRCLFFCGIKPPEPRPLFEFPRYDWSEREMRKGKVVFVPTPAGIQPPELVRSA